MVGSDLFHIVLCDNLQFLHNDPYRNYCSGLNGKFPCFVLEIYSRDLLSFSPAPIALLYATNGTYMTDIGIITLGRFFQLEIGIDGL